MGDRSRVSGRRAICAPFDITAQPPPCRLRVDAPGGAYEHELRLRAKSTPHHDSKPYYRSVLRGGLQFRNVGYGMLVKERMIEKEFVLHFASAHSSTNFACGAQRSRPRASRPSSPRRCSRSGPRTASPDRRAIDSMHSNRHRNGARMTYLQGECSNRRLEE